MIFVSERGLNVLHGDDRAVGRPFVNIARGDIFIINVSGETIKRPSTSVIQIYSNKIERVIVMSTKS